MDVFSDNQKTPVDVALALLDKENIPLTTNTRNVAVANLVMIAEDYAYEKKADRIGHFWKVLKTANQLNEISFKGWRATDVKEMFKSVLVVDAKMASTAKDRLIGAQE